MLFGRSKTQMIVEFGARSLMVCSIFGVVVVAVRVLKNALYRACSMFVNSSRICTKRDFVSIHRESKMSLILPETL